MFIATNHSQRSRSVRRETRQQNLHKGKSDCAPTELRSKERTGSYKHLAPLRPRSGEANEIWKIFGLSDRIIVGPSTTDRHEYLSYLACVRSVASNFFFRSNPQR